MQSELGHIAQDRPKASTDRDTAPRDYTTGWEGHRHLRCLGRPVYRSRAAVDLALVLDMMPEVKEWVCVPSPIELRAADGEIFSHVADFFVRRMDSTCFYVDAEGCDGWSAAEPTVNYVSAPSAGLTDETTVRNARGIMSYACMKVPLADQIRLLCRIDDAGPITLVEASREMTETYDPMGAVLALAAQRIIRLELDASIIGPRTVVRRFTSGAATAPENQVRRRPTGIKSAASESAPQPFPSFRRRVAMPALVEQEHAR